MEMLGRRMMGDGFDETMMTTSPPGVCRPISPNASWASRPKTELTAHNVTMAPIANSHRPSPWVDAIEPSRNTVSRYTCGLSHVSARQVSTADVTEKPVAQLIRDIRRSRTFKSAIHRSCSPPRLASNRGSISRERSTIRDSREASTFRNAPMPLAMWKRSMNMRAGMRR